jgi:TPR repeat protein
MEPLDIAPAVSLSLGATRARMPQNPRRRAWLTSAAFGVIGCILAAWGSGPSTPTVQVQPAPAAPLSDSAALAGACDAGAAIACNDLGVVSLHATPRDWALAVQSFQRACEGGSADGCSNLGALYEKGAGVRADANEAVSLYRRACAGGAALGCSNLGALYARGKGVTRDASEAQRLFQQACEGGSAMGCNNLMLLSSKASRFPLSGSAGSLR